MAGQSSLLPYVMGVAGFLGVFQSATWFILSILAISSYFCRMVVQNTSEFSFATYIMYFSGDSCKFGIVHDGMEAKSVMIMMFLYLITSFAWFVISVILIVHKNKDGMTSPSVKYCWSVLTLIISVLDLALGVMFGMDHHHYKTKPPRFDMEMQVSAVMMTVALRGFVLWIVNVYCALMILIAALTNQEEQSSESNHGKSNNRFQDRGQDRDDDFSRPIEAYGYPSSGQGVINDAFIWPDRPYHNQPMTPVNPAPPVQLPFSPRGLEERSRPPVAPKPYGLMRQPVVPYPDYDNAPSQLPRAHIRQYYQGRGREGY